MVIINLPALLEECRKRVLIHNREAFCVTFDRMTLKVFNVLYLVKTNFPAKFEV